MSDKPTGHADGFPDPETLAAYVDGTLDAATRADVEAHAADCRDCREIFADTAAFLLSIEGQAEAAPEPAVKPEAGPAPSVLRFKSRWRNGAIAALAVAAAALIVVRVEPSWLLWSERSPDTSVLVRALDNQATRPIEGRLSGSMAYRRPPEVMRGGPGRDAPPDLQIAASELEIAASGQSAAQQAARGIAALVVGQTDSGIVALEEAVRRSPSDAAYLNDLAAAYLARAARTGSTDDLGLALQNADRALAVKPSLPESLFNRALALQGLERADEQRAAWQSYLKVDPDSEWAREARHRCGC